jgi:hypothetical protein
LWKQLDPESWHGYVHFVDGKLAAAAMCKATVSILQAKSNRP